MPSGRTNIFPWKWAWPKSRDPTIFGIRSNISLKLLELGTSNLIHSFVWAMPSRCTNRFPWKWAWPRSRAWLLVFLGPFLLRTVLPGPFCRIPVKNRQQSDFVVGGQNFCFSPFNGNISNDAAVAGDSDDSDVVTGDASYVSSLSLLLLLSAVSHNASCEHQWYGMDHCRQKLHATYKLHCRISIQTFIVEHCTVSLDDDFGGRLRIIHILMCIYPLTPSSPANLHKKLPGFPLPRFPLLRFWRLLTNHPVDPNDYMRR